MVTFVVVPLDLPCHENRGIGSFCVSFVTSDRWQRSCVDTVDAIGRDDLRTRPSAANLWRIDRLCGGLEMETKHAGSSPALMGAGADVCGSTTRRESEASAPGKKRSPNSSPSPHHNQILPHPHLIVIDL